MKASNIAVVISPPRFDLDLYPFDEEAYDRVVDEILSDEASFGEYNGDLMMDGSYEDSPSWYRGGSGAEQTESPYFSLEKKDKTAARTEKSIARIDAEDSEESGDTENEAQDEDQVDNVQNHMVNSETTKKDTIAVDDQLDDDNLPVDDEVTEEDAVFASLGPDQREELRGFILSHPFMRKGKYPVKRSDRRRFTDAMRDEAGAVGMNEAATNRLLRFVKKTYFDIYEISCPGLDGSEFGDEIDEEKEKQQKEAKKERKRKRNSGEKSKDKSKKSKRVSNESIQQDLDFPQNNGNESRQDEAMDVEDHMDDVTGLPQKSHGLDDEPVLEPLDSTVRAASHESEKVKQNAQPIVEIVQTIQHPIVELDSYSNPGEANFENANLGEREHPISFHDGSDGETKENIASQQMLPQHTFNAASKSMSKTEQSQGNDTPHHPVSGGRNRERNHHKRQKRKERKAKRHRESLGVLENTHPSQDNAPQGHAQKSGQAGAKQPTETTTKESNGFVVEKSILDDPFWDSDF
ncbi:hypothetical protein AWENTII_008334 [Aspergillus wentii]|nr:hypothetical protein MW887_008256 [Aspergillus wentii]